MADSSTVAPHSNHVKHVDTFLSYPTSNYEQFYVQTKTLAIVEISRTVQN